MLKSKAKGLGKEPKVLSKKSTKKATKKVVAKKAVKKVAKKTTKKKAVKKTFDELVLEHRENGRKLGRSILRKWRVRMPSDEIDSVVDLALCEAAKRYCPDKGAAFMTFFFYHLRGHLVRTVSKAAHQGNIFMAFAASTGIEASEWHDIDAEVLWGYVPDQSVFGKKEVETPEKKILRNEKINECREALSKLDDLEKQILIRSYQKEQPLVDIAKSLGYSRCHISRVKKSALGQMKANLSKDPKDKKPKHKRRARRISDKRLAS